MPPNVALICASFFLPCFPLVNNQPQLSFSSSLLVQAFCLEGIIFSQSRMPQLDKFTYFILWSCLFLFMFYILIKLIFIPVHMEALLYSYYV